jgi:3'-phosphoadenosine 5'-phosphosulfate sulfotransferase (PAPS reductase)/FAD synthetase
MTKISPRIINILSMGLMVLLMTLFVVFVTTIFNYGFSSDFFIRWMKGWGLSFIIAFPTVLVIMPFIRKIVSKLAQSSNDRSDNEVSK